MQMLEQKNDFVSPRVSFRRNGSLMCSYPSLLVDSISRKSFSYNKLPSQPLTLTVIKLDGSSFVIEVPKSGTVAHLKQGVEKAFSHLPKKGPGTVSWPHVWGHFCLCYHGQKLLTDSDHIGSYGIQDGEQLHFVRHVSISYNMVKEKQEDPDLDKQVIDGILPARIFAHGSEGCKDGQDDEYKDDKDRARENQKAIYDENDEAEQGVMRYCQYKLAHLFGRWFSYQKLESPNFTMEDTGFSPRSPLGSLGSFRNGPRLSSYKYDYQREAWKAK